MANTMQPPSRSWDKTVAPIKYTTYPFIQRDIQFCHHSKIPIVSIDIIIKHATKQ